MSALIWVGVAVVAAVVLLLAKGSVSLAARPRVSGPHTLPPGDCRVLLEKDPEHLIAAIRELRALTGWDLRSAKWALEREEILTGITLEDAERVVAIVSQHGGEARLDEV